MVFCPEHTLSETTSIPPSHMGDRPPAGEKHQHPWNCCIEEWLTLPLSGPGDFLKKIACARASRERTREGLSLSLLLLRASRVTCRGSPNWRVYSQVIRKGNYFTLPDDEHINYKSMHKIIILIIDTSLVFSSWTWSGVQSHYSYMTDVFELYHLLHSFSQCCKKSRWYETWNKYKRKAISI